MRFLKFSQGFRKVVPERWEFANDYFRRGEKSLLCDIQRRKSAMPVTSPSPAAAVSIPTTSRALSPMNSGEEQVLSSNSSGLAPPAAAAADLTEENNRLRKENERLSRELAQMRKICRQIAGLVSSYASEGHDSARETAELEELAAATLLELMPMAAACDKKRVEVRSVKPEEEAESASAEAASSSQRTSLKLFGVSIGMKRSSEEDDDSAPPKVEPTEELSESVVDRPRPKRRGCSGS